MSADTKAKAAEIAGSILQTLMQNHTASMNGANGTGDAIAAAERDAKYLVHVYKSLHSAINSSMT